jgi:O-antigen/teichoic acid export membrane protein
MGLIQKDAFKTTLLSYIGIGVGYLNRGVLFLICFSTEQIGLLNLVISVGLFFAQGANLGAVFTVLKFLPFFKNKEKKHHGFFPLMLLVVLSGITLFTGLYVLFKPQIQDLYVNKSPMFLSYYYWVLPIGISYVLFLFLEAFLRSLFKNIIAVFAFEICLRLSITALLFLSFFKVISFPTFVALHSLFYAVPTLILIGYMYVIKELNLSFESIQLSNRFKKIVLHFSTFNYFNSLGAVLVNALDVIMIAQMIGLKATGVYSTVVFLTSALQVPYKSLLRISTPLISEYWKHRQFDKMKELYQKVSSVSLFIGLFTFLPIWLNIHFLFSFLKPEFQEGKWVFLFLMIGRLMDMYFGLNGAIFSTSKKYKFDLLFTILLIGTVYVLNLVLIPIWGISGAAISTASALIIYNVGRVVFVWRIYKMHPFTKQQFIILLFAFATLLAGQFISNLPFNNWQMVITQCVTFFVLFVAPIYFFKLEIEVLIYLQKGKSYLSSFKK